VLIPKCEEEGLVLYDWTTVVQRVLIRIPPIERRRTPLAGQRIPLVIVQPAIGGHRGVSIVPDRSSAKSVRAGLRQDLNLSIAPSQFGIDGRKNNADFADEIGI